MSSTEIFKADRSTVINPNGAPVTLPMRISPVAKEGLVSAGLEMVIGIDPDLEKSGIAIVTDGKLTALGTMGFFELTEYILEHKHVAHFVVEDVEHDKTTYHRPGANQAAMRKIAQNVGQVKAIGRLLGVYLNGCDAQFTLIKPLKGHAKKAKNDANFFNQLTGWQGKSNQDKRDAALLALSYTGSIKL